MPKSVIGMNIIAVPRKTSAWLSVREYRVNPTFSFRSNGALRVSGCPPVISFQHLADNFVAAVGLVKDGQLLPAAGRGGQFNG